MAEDNFVTRVLSRELSLDSAVADSPIFRANLQIHEDDVEELAAWLDAITKILRNILDSSSCMFPSFMQCL
jgi:BAR domain of APPL family